MHPSPRETRQTAQPVRPPMPMPSPVEADDPLQALYQDAPALAEIAALLGHGGFGASALSLVVGALMRLPPSHRAAAASALLARLLRARREQRSARRLAVPAMPVIRDHDPLLTAVRTLAALLLSALLAVWLAGRWPDDAEAWSVALDAALDEIAEAADHTPDPMLFDQDQRSCMAGDTGAGPRPAPSLSGAVSNAAQDRTGAQARLTALIVRAQAVGLTVPMPDGTRLELNAAMLDADDALAVAELELPLPPAR